MQSKAGGLIGAGLHPGALYECGQKNVRGQDVNTVGQHVAIAFQRDLVAPRDVEPVLEVADRRIGAVAAQLGLDCEPGIFVESDQEVDLVAGSVSKEIQRNSVTLTVFDVVAELEEVGGDEVFETGALGRDFTPVPQIELRHAFERPYASRGPRQDPKGVVQSIEDVHPVADRPVACVEVFSEAVERQWGTDPFGEKVGKDLDLGNRPDFLEVADVLEQDAVDSLFLPSSEGSRRLGQKRLGKSAEPHQGINGRAVAVGREGKLLIHVNEGGVPIRPFDLRKRKRVEAIVVVPTLERVSSTTVDVEPSAARHTGF